MSMNSSREISENRISPPLRMGRSVPAMIFFFAGVLVSASALVGCQTFKTTQSRREFVLENTWTRSTLNEEFLGYRRMNRMPPLLIDKMILQANAVDGLVAFDRTTGKQLWRMNLAGGAEGGVQVVGERVFFGSSNGRFYCLQLGNGREVWSVPVRAETLAPPSVEKGVVYFQSGAEIVYALDAQTGKQLWSYNRQVTANLSIRATTRPVVAGETLLVGFSDGYLVALRKRDGGVLWERKLGKSNRFQDVDSTPVVSGNSIFVSSFDAALYSLNLEDGKINWVVDEGGYVPVTVGSGNFSDRLFYSTATGKILTIDKQSGKALQTIALKKGIATQPALYKNYLIYGESEGDLVVADLQGGRPLARFSPGDGLVSRPSIREDSGEIYFISNAANLYALRIGYRRINDRLPWSQNF